MFSTAGLRPVDAIYTGATRLLAGTSSATRIATGRLAWLLLAALIFPLLASAELPPAPRALLAPPMGLGSECGLLLSCPWSGPFGVNLRLGGQLWIPGEQDPRPRIGLFGWAGLSTSIWRWAELGVIFSGRLANPDEQGQKRGENVLLAHPLTLWARLTPQVRDSGLAIAAEVQHLAGAAPFNGGGHLFPDAQQYSLMLGHASRFTRAFTTLTYQQADGRSYTGLQGGAGLWVGVPKIGLGIGAEGLARFGAQGEGRTVAWTGTIGIRVWDIHGAAFATGYQWGGGPGVPAQGPLASFGISYGPSYVPHPKEPAGPAVDQLIGMFLWFAGYRDPIVGADGNIWSDDGKRILYRFGVRDPYHPGYILPFRGGASVRVGEGVLVRDRDTQVRTYSGVFLGYALHLDTGGAVDRAIKNHRDEEKARGTRSAACDMCRPDPMPDYSPGGAGYYAACALLRLIRCEERPWDPRASSPAPPRPPGYFGALRRPTVAPTPRRGTATHAPPALRPPPPPAPRPVQPRPALPQSGAAEHVPPPLRTPVRYVPENASMRPDAAKYQAGAEGARPGQAPALARSKGREVRFDGLVERDGMLIDRKRAIPMTPKMDNTARRQDEALRLANRRAVWEVPNETQARRARMIFERNGVTNIDVRVVPE